MAELSASYSQVAAIAACTPLGSASLRPRHMWPRVEPGNRRQRRVSRLGPHSGTSGENTALRPRRSADSAMTICWIMRMVSCRSDPDDSVASKSRIAASGAVWIRSFTPPSWD